MTIDEFKNSGYLEAYVLGALTEKDMSFVKQWLAEEEVSTELSSLQNVLVKLAEEHAIPPPGYIKNQIFHDL